MEKQIIKYKHWKTGKKRTYELGKSCNERKTKRICPFDKTPLVFRFDKYFQAVVCINCGEQYIDDTQEEINEHAKYIALHNKKTLKELGKKRKDLTARIKHAEFVGIISKEK